MSTESSVIKRSTLDSDVQKTLRNTFYMLFLSLVVTAAAGYVAIAAGTIEFLTANTSLVFIAFIAQFALIFVINAFRHKPGAFWGLIIFSVLEGAILVPLLALKASDPMVIVQAFGITAVILAVCSGIGANPKADYTPWGKYLFIALIAALVGLIVNIFVASAMLDTMMSCFIIALFTLYIIYDVNRIVHRGETCYINAALGLYLNVLNIFIHLVNLGDD